MYLKKFSIVDFYIFEVLGVINDNVYNDIWDLMLYMYVYVIIIDIVMCEFC